MNSDPGFARSLPFPPAVKYLVFANVGIWLILQVIIEGLILKEPVLSGRLSLIPDRVLLGGAVWQLITYAFLHTSGVTHILFNMLMLWFFGAELELRWGRRYFLTYYFACGIGAAVIYVLGVGLAASLFGVGTSSLFIPVQGASGAIFGILLAYGLLFGDRTIHFFMVFPMKARVFVLIMGVVEFASLLSSYERNSGVAYLAHLGGIAAGFAFLKGSGWWQRRQWNRKLMQKSKSQHLKLVVDNDKSKDDPKYWN